MKKAKVFVAMAMLVVALASCGKDEYKKFIGTWGVERLDYYNIDYAGNPIEATIKTYYFTPGDMNDGLDLIFREDKTGEMRDRSRDTLYIPVIENKVIVDSLIVVNPDTTLVTTFTYSYNANEDLVFMNTKNTIVESVDGVIQDRVRTYIYQMKVNFVDDDSFFYENEYNIDFVEKAWLRRYTTETRGATRGAKSSQIPAHPNSLFSNY